MLIQSKHDSILQTAISLWLNVKIRYVNMFYKIKIPHQLLKKTNKPVTKINSSKPLK